MKANPRPHRINPQTELVCACALLFWLPLLTSCLDSRTSGAYSADPAPQAAMESAKDTHVQPGSIATSEGSPTPNSQPDMVRASSLAGRWFTDSGPALSAQIDSFIKNARYEGITGYPIALLAPHAGYSFSGPTAAAAYHTLRGRTYSRVFIIGPSHTTQFTGVSLPSWTHYETPIGKVAIDQNAILQLAGNALFQVRSDADAREHCIEVQLPFLQRVLDKFTIVPLIVGKLDASQVDTVADVIRSQLRPGDLVIVSSDFTHYGPNYSYMGPPQKRIPKNEASGRLAGLMDAAWLCIKGLDPVCWSSHLAETRDTICGHEPVAILLRLLPKGTEPFRLSSTTSGEITGDWSNSVSYLSAAFTGNWPYLDAAGSQSLTDAEKTALLKLARGALEQSVRTGRIPTPSELGVTPTSRMTQPSGAFVTLKIDGELRGCIGNIMPDNGLVDSVLKNAANAALHDRRFDPVNVDELPRITVEVSVLTTPEPVASWQDVVLGKHGVLLTKGNKRSVFLPQVACEQGWTLEQTMTHLSRKAGLGNDDWRQDASFHVFEAIVFHEE